MSKEYPCIHYYDDGKCKYFSDDEVTSYCVKGPCGAQVLSIADRIRTMTDEELAALLYDDVAIDDKLHFCQMRQECDDAIDRDELIPDKKCRACLLAKLKQPVDHFREVTKMVEEVQNHA